MQATNRKAPWCQSNVPSAGPPGRERGIECTISMLVFLQIVSGLQRESPWATGTSVEKNGPKHRLLIRE